MNPFSFVYLATSTTTEPVHHAASWVEQTIATTVNTLSPFYEELTDVNALKQLIAVFLACFLSWLASRYFSQKVLCWESHWRGKRFINRVKRFFLELARRMCFSVVAALILSLCTLLLTGSAWMGPAALRHLYIIRIGYSIFYSWAFLMLLMSVLTLIMGRKAFGPTAQSIVCWFFWILAALQILGLMPLLVGAMQKVRLPIGSDRMTLWTALIGLLTVFFTVGIANWIANVCEAAIRANARLEPNVKVVLARLIRIVLLVLAVLIALSSVGINLAVLSVFGGAIGVGIGFGMQKIASNYISGFIILFDRSLKIGDLVEVDGFRGIVTQINTRYSVLKNPVGEEFIVPNENLVTGTVRNFSHSENRVSVSVDMGIAYESDVDKAMEVFLQVVKQQDRVIADPAPYCFVSELADSCVNLRATFWVYNPQQPTGILVSNIYREALLKLEQAGIEIPYNKEDLSIKGTIALTQAAGDKTVRVNK